MDAGQFDDLARSLSSSVSRRRLFGALTVGLLAAIPLAFGSDPASARKKRKKKKKKTGGATPLPPATPPPTPVCRPTCAGKTCGSDGCGGFCGPCAGGSCPNGTCICPADFTFCRGECIAPCIGKAIVSPLTCECCLTGGVCDPFDGDGGETCCSGICQPNSGGGDPGFCVARNLGAPCDFDAECQNTGCPPDQCPIALRPICRDKLCACPNETEACNGECVPLCTGPNVKKPGACSCCRRNGQPCATFVPCCSGRAVCDGVCQGLPPDAPCTFDEQCTSNVCTLDFCE